MEQQEVLQSIDRLGEAFEVFKKNHSDRLGSLEIAMRRPSVDRHQSEAENSGLVDYLRKGDENGLQTKALSSTSDASGGYLVPKPVLDKIQSTLQGYSPFRTLARVSQISTDALELLLDKGAQAEVGWVAETANRDETATPDLAKLRIPVHQIYAKPKASQKLLDDAAMDIESWLIQKIADRMAEIENQAFIHGDGQNKPKGFMTYPTVAAGQGVWGSFEEIKTGKDGVIDEPDSLVKLFYSLKPQYLRGAVWLMGRSALSAIRQIKDATGQFIWQPSVMTGTPSTLLGHPVVVCDDMPALVRGTASKSIALGNFGEAYQIVDRCEMNILRDPYSAKPYVEFYATKRVGGDVVNFEAVKILNCARG